MLESLRPLTGRGAVLVCNLAATQYIIVPSLDQFQLRPQFMNHGGKDTSFLLEGHYYLRLLKVSKPVPPL